MGVSQGCLREDLHVREEGLRSRGGASGPGSRAAVALRRLAGHGLPFTVLSPASSGKIFGFIGGSVKAGCAELAGVCLSQHSVIYWWALSAWGRQNKSPALFLLGPSF